MPTQAKSHNTPFDVLHARLAQSRAAVIVLQNSYDPEQSEYFTPSNFLYELLWGVEELLGQAQEAMDDLMAIEIAELGHHRTQVTN